MTTSTGLGTVDRHLTVTDVLLLLATIAASAGWVVGCTGGIKFGILAAIALTNVSALIWGRVVVWMIAGPTIFPRSFPITFLTGSLVVRALVFMMKLAIPISIAATFVLVAILGAALYALRAAAIAEWTPSRRAGTTDFLAVVASLLAATFWIQNLMPERVPTEDGLFSRMFIEYYSHTVHASPLLHDETPFSFGSPYFAGEPWPFYQLAGYTLPVLAADASGTPLAPMLPALWFPTGLFFVGLGAYLLTGAMFGSRFGLWGLAAILLPDPTFWSWEVIPYSFLRVAEASPSSTYGVSVMALSLCWIIAGLQSARRLLIVGGVAAMFGCFIFRPQFLVAGLPAVVYVLAFGKEDKLSRKTMVGLAVFFVVGALGFLFAKQFQSAPSVALELNAGGELVEWVSKLTPAESPLQRLAVEPDNARLWETLPRRALFLLYATFQGLLPVWILFFVGSVVFPAERRAWTWFPVFSVAVYLTIALFLIPNRNGDPFELQHRTFFWYYLLLVCWLGGQAGTWIARLGAPSVALSAAACIVALAGPALYGREPRMPIVVAEHQLHQGYLDSLAFLRGTAGPRDAVVDSDDDQLLITAALSERKAFVTWGPYFNIPGQGAVFQLRQERWDEVDELLAATQPHEIHAWFERTGVRWLLVHPESNLAWPQSIRPAFASAGYRVFDLSKIGESP